MQTGWIASLLKGILFLCLVIRLQPAAAQGSWERIDLPVDRALNAVYFSDSLYGWIVGDSGLILHTSDGGNNWIKQESGTSNDIIDVFFLNRNYGWASSFNFSSSPFGTVLLKTYNGGLNWLKESYPENNIFITCILFLDSLHGWMGGRPHALVKTTNGGTTWQQAAIDTSILAFFPVLDIQFYDENFGYASGGMFDIAGVVWRTDNGGELWYAIEPSFAPADEVHGLYLLDSLRVIGAGGDPDFGYGVGMIRTQDGGLNWQYDELGIQGNAYDIDFRTDYEAWAPLGPQRKFIYSLDSGNTWTDIFTPDSSAIFDVTFPDSLHGFAVGHEGAALKYKPPFPTQVQSHTVQQHKGIILYPNYPNPFKNSSIIQFTIPASGKSKTHVRLKVFNVYGMEMETIINTLLEPGTHKTTIDATGLDEGIYFYNLQLQGCSLSRKMVVMR